MKALFLGFYSLFFSIPLFAESHLEVIADNTPFDSVMESLEGDRSKLYFNYYLEKDLKLKKGSRIPLNKSCFIEYVPSLYDETKAVLLKQGHYQFLILHLHSLTSMLSVTVSQKAGFRGSFVCNVHSNPSTSYTMGEFREALTSGSSSPWNFYQREVHSTPHWKKASFLEEKLPEEPAVEINPNNED